MWRRILQLPFTQVIPEAERDDRIKLALRTDPAVQTAILAWAVQGCLQWQDEGLAVPQCVRNYTAAYRGEMDPIRDWLADCCTDDAVAWTANAELRESCEAWCHANGERPVSIKRLGFPPRNKRLRRRPRRHLQATRKERNPCLLRRH